ncbi:hypothetical protein SHKM778_94090 (plasmid) [Streptomyces sp. KM77-8]|uniref:Uncharacterized protein n=1 Tax=Streptomyces haneummycinicus TaxID=3074435 RepID=A0AAT9HZM2_9ACTN
MGLLTVGFAYSRLPSGPIGKRVRQAPHFQYATGTLSSHGPPTGGRLLMRESSLEPARDGR